MINVFIKDVDHLAISYPKAPQTIDNVIAANSGLFLSGLIWIISVAAPLKDVIKAIVLSSSSHIFFAATTPNCGLNALKLVVPSNRGAFTLIELVVTSLLQRQYYLFKHAPFVTRNLFDVTFIE
uniref:Uncharacterized protein n=1 Tax=Glossina austeni TaxID=7395 RepID=A0A1A9V7V8_GLOAU